MPRLTRARIRAGRLRRRAGRLARHPELAWPALRRTVRRHLYRLTMASPVVRRQLLRQLRRLTHGAPAQGRGGLREALLRAIEAVEHAAYLQALFETDPLLAYRHLRDHTCLNRAPITLLRAMQQRLREYGYLAHAVDVLRVIAGISGSSRDQAMLARRETELAFHSGAWSPSIKVGSAPVLRMPGSVLHVVGKGLPQTQTGYTLRTQYLLRAQREAGYDARVFCQVNEGMPVAEPGWTMVDDVPYYVHPGPGKLEVSTQEWMEANVAALLSVVGQVRPWALHAHSDFHNAQIATAVGRATGVPVVYESRGFWEETWLSRTMDRFGLSSTSYFISRLGMPDVYTCRAEREREARCSADVVVTLADTMREHILRRGPQDREVFVVPNGVDVAAFARSGSQPDLRRQLGIPESAMVVGYISSLVEYEGIDILIDGFTAMEPASPAHLVIVGDGVARDRLERRAGASPAGSRIRFTGRVEHSQIAAYYGLIDIFVVPRRASQVCQLVTPIKPFEALAAGCCVVVSDVAALREISQDSGEAITIFTAESASSLREVLIALERDRGLRLAKAEAGRTWVREHRSWSAVVERYEPAYAQVGLTRPFAAAR